MYIEDVNAVQSNPLLTVTGNTGMIQIEFRAAFGSQLLYSQQQKIVE